MNARLRLSQSSQQSVPAKPSSQSTPMVTAQVEQMPAASDECVRESQVALAAYFRAEKRGFAPGGEQDDWFAAENELRDNSAR